MLILLASLERLVKPPGWLSTNIVPLRVTRTELLRGLYKFGNDIYTPEASGSRLCDALNRLGPSRGCPRPSGSKPTAERMQLSHEVSAIIDRLYQSGSAERTMVNQVMAVALSRPEGAVELTCIALLFYAQIRHVYSIMGLSTELM